MGTPLTFKVFRGDELLRTESFERDVIKIGRLASAHLRLDDAQVSRIHSVVEVAADGRMSVVDMGGPVGTLLNGRRVRRGALRAGDELVLGGVRLVVEQGLPATANVAVPAPSGAASTATAATAVGSAHASPDGPPPEKDPPRREPPVEEPPGRRNKPPVEDPNPPAKPIREPGKPPAAPERLAGDTAGTLDAWDADASGDLGAELRLFWGDTLLEARTFVRPAKPIRVGEREDCALRVSSPELAGEALEFLRWDGGEYRVTSPRDGREHVLSEGLAVRVELGARLAVVARLRTPPPPALLPWWERSNWKFANLVLLLAFVGGAFVIGADGARRAHSALDEPTQIDPVRLTRFIEPAPAPKKERVARGEVPKADDQKPGESGEKHRGAEGQMGKRDAPKVQARSAPKAVDPRDPEVVKQAGLLAVLGGGKGAPEGLSTVLGRGGLGGDLKGAVGNMFGAKVGDSFGFGGLGLKGEGQGGGGSGQTIGIGAVGTKGRGGGMGGYGSGVGGLGKKGDSQIGIATADARVMGAIDPELIRRVIREHASQVRYCYEQQLALDPKLEGKISIRWQIEADGRATNTQVELGETTLRNADVQRCIMSRIVTWPFPKPKGGGIAVVKYPWILRTSGSAG